MLPKTYSKTHDGQSKWMHFLIEEDDLLEKSNTIWDKLIRVLKKGLTKWMCFLIHDDGLLKNFAIKNDEDYYLEVYLKFVDIKIIF